jgi:L-amino acid N-acyltransferase YncA
MKCIEYAKSKGVKVARLVTESDNAAALATVQKMGFKPVAEFLEMELENVSKAESLSSSWASTNQFETVWRYLQSFFRGLSLCCGVIPSSLPLVFIG